VSSRGRQLPRLELSLSREAGVLERSTSSNSAADQAANRPHHATARGGSSRPLHPVIPKGPRVGSVEATRAIRKGRRGLSSAPYPLQGAEHDSTAPHTGSVSAITPGNDPGGATSPTNSNHSTKRRVARRVGSTPAADLHASLPASAEFTAAFAQYRSKDGAAEDSEVEKRQTTPTVHEGREGSEKKATPQERKPFSGFNTDSAMHVPLLAAASDARKPRR
jgi:hypothetical protein